MKKDSVRTTIGPFAITPLWLLKAPISPGAIVAWGILWAEWADKEGKCWPSHALVAGRMQVSDRTVRNYISELEKIGALTVVNRARDDGSQTSNLYILDPTTPESRFQGGGKNLPGGVEMDFQGGWKETSDEPYPEEPDPEEPHTSSSSASQPRDTIITDGEVVEDYDKSVDDADASVDGASEAASTTSDAPLSHPSPITPEVSEAMTMLIEDGHDAKDVQAVLLGTYKGFGKGAAEWTTHRGKSYPAEVLANSVRLAVEFADACDAAGNKRPNPYTQKEAKPFRLLLTNDEKSIRHIRLLIAWTFADKFWYCNVLCAAKFREKWDQLAGRRRAELSDARSRSQDANQGGEDWMARRRAG